MRSRIAGSAIGADGYLPTMGTEDFLLCLSRRALDASCKGTPILPRARVRETRAALVDHYKDGHFVHPTALFAPDTKEVADFLKHSEVVDDDEGQINEVPVVPGDDDQPGTDPIDEEPGDEPNSGAGGEPSDEEDTAFGIAAE